MLIHDKHTKLFGQHVTPNPLAAEATGQTMAWARTFGLGDGSTLDKLEGDDPGMYAACVFPTADQDILDLCARYFAWLILFDDRYGECRTRDDQVTLGSLITRVGKPVQAIPFLEAIDDLTERGRAMSLDKDTWAWRFNANVRGYMRGCETEARYRIVQTVPSFAAYEAFRPSTIGALPILDILDLEAPMTSAWPPHLRATGDIRRRVSCLFAWANDVITYKACRTEADEEDRLNLVTVIATENGISIEGAKEAAAELYNWELTQLLKELEDWPARPEGTEAGRYARAILAAVDGNLAWYMSSKRYVGR